MKIGKRKNALVSIGLLLALLSVSVAFALNYLQIWLIPISFHVKPHGFKMYSDPECTTEFSEWSLGDLEMLNDFDRVQYKVVYAKNFEETGTFPLNITWSIQDLTIDTLPCVIGQLPSGINTVLQDGKIIMYISVSYYSTTWVIWNSENTTIPKIHSLFGVVQYRLYCEFTANFPSDEIAMFTYDFEASA